MNTPKDPEIVRWLLEYTFNGEEKGSAIYESEAACRASAESDGGVCTPLARLTSIEAAAELVAAEDLTDLIFNPTMGAGIELVKRIGALIAERNSLRADAIKAERRAIMFGDTISNHCIAMQSAVIDAELQGAEHGMEWIQNTLCGPGLLPDMKEARSMPTVVMQSVAQAWFDAKSAEHDAFRAAHPAPELPAVVHPQAGADGAVGVAP
jgi:hypothetical protein